MISSIPKDIYDPDDFTTPASQQRETIENAYKNGLITDRQYLAAYLDTDKKSENGSTSSSTAGSTGSSTSGDTYIPAHGTSGTVNDAAPDPNYVPPHANANIDFSGDTNVPIN